MSDPAWPSAFTRSDGVAVRHREAARHVAATWLADYADAVDTADLEGLGQLCAGVTVHAPTGAEGTGEEVAAIYAPLVLAPDGDGRRRTKHHITNVSLRFPDEGSAVVRAYYLLVKEVDGQPGIAGSGRYETHLVVAGAAWHVREHRVTRDLTRT